jgi:hypothetical protein
MDERSMQIDCERRIAALQSRGRLPQNLQLALDLYAQALSFLNDGDPESAAKLITEAESVL